jgi:SAM-dependent MidA family methyltransferase
MPAIRAVELTPLSTILSDRVHGHGLITFAEYMETCLYHPKHGYYTKAGQQPRRDYFTSVDASPLFGRLLARQFHDMWRHLNQPSEFTLLEAGAGSGDLAGQILTFIAATFPEFYAALNYHALERSPVRCVSLSESLKAHIERKRLVVSSGMPTRIPCGCIFSNEFFDALPVHRVIVEGGELRELYVACGPGGFHEQTGPLSLSTLAEYFREQGITLQEGQRAEVNLGACDWIQEFGKCLQRGFVLTIDYGHEAAELYDQRHTRGTLLAYRRHRATEDFLLAPGEQDLTAHVNFSALEKWGTRGELRRTGITTQSAFLMSIARAGNFAELEAEGMSEAERLRARLLFKTLIYPEGMGETFQVLVQHKNIESPRLCGLEPL